MEAAQRLGKPEEVMFARIPEEFITSPGWSVKLVQIPVPYAGDVSDEETTARIQLLAENLLPTAVHMANFYHLPQSQWLNLVYTDSRSSIEENSNLLLGFLSRISGQQELWVPLASSHSMLLNVLGRILPQLQSMDLSRNPLLYIGDHANFPAFKRLAESCDMPIFCQATY